MSAVLLEARGLTKRFPLSRGQVLHAVNDVSLQLREGQTLALVGESGCGKSTLGRMLAYLISPTSGAVLWRGKDISALSDKAFFPYPTQIQLVFQDPYASLDPRMNVRSLVAEPLVTHHLCEGKEAVTRRVLQLLQAVGLPESSLNRYPHQFSGGQRQRIGIARAIAADPAFIVCDEPVSALDISVQNQILNLIADLQRQKRFACLFITHDLSVARHVADQVCVMYLGRICEAGSAGEVFSAPRHPYTRFLLNAVPQPDPHTRGNALPLLTGEVPSPVHPPDGCCFHTRCPYATARCRQEVPPPLETDGRTVACFHPLSEAGY